MSGFEPLALASAAGETAGVATLAAEVTAPMFAADAAFIPAAGTLAELSPMLGMGAAGLGGLGGLLGGGVYGSLPTAITASNIGSLVAPEAAAQISEAIANAAPGANQIMPEATRNWLQSSTAGYGNVADSDLINRLAQGSGDEIARLGGVEAGSAIDKPYVLTQTPTPNLPSAMTMEGVGGTPSSGGLMDAIKSMGSKVGQWWDEKKPEEKMLYGGAGLLAANALLGKKSDVPEKEPYKGPLSKFKYDPNLYTPYIPTPPTPYTPVYRDYRRFAGGGPVEMMSNANAVGANTGYPMADINKPVYASPYQTPISSNVVHGTSDTGVNPMTGEMTNFASGGISDLGAYSDYARGGRMLKGPGDGMSDNIPATIAGKQPARLANEEFVIPADVVSHLGNGSSDAGAKQLYKMMDRVRQARTGTKKQGKQINPEKYLA